MKTKDKEYCITKKDVDRQIYSLQDMGVSLSGEDVKTIKFMPIKEFYDKVSEGEGWGFYADVCSRVHDVEYPSEEDEFEYQSAIDFCERVDNIRDALDDGETIPPIPLNRFQGITIRNTPNREEVERESYDLIDGNHRASAFILEGFKKIPVVTFNKKIYL